MALSLDRLNHLHVVVDDLDRASAFYRDVFGSIEMQSHHDLVNTGLATYYGRGDRPESLRVSLRFIALPDVITLKLVKIDDLDYHGSSYRGPSNAAAGYPADYGVGPISVVVSDLDAAYSELLAIARDYDAPYRIQLLSPPTFLSPLLPHQIGATEHSALKGEDAVLAAIAEKFAERAKFMMIDPFGVKWEFNNDVL